MRLPVDLLSLIVTEFQKNMTLFGQLLHINLLNRVTSVLVSVKFPSVVSLFGSRE